MSINGYEYVLRFGDDLVREPLVFDGKKQVKVLEVDFDGATVRHLDGNEEKIQLPDLTVELV